MNPPNRLPPYRDFADLQKNINKFLNKKNYVPNLAISRNAPSRPKTEENNADVKKEETVPAKEKRRPNRYERKILTAGETFAPTNESRSKISVKGRSKTANITVSNVSVKKETYDKNVQTKQLASKFEKMMSTSSSDLPMSLPFPRSVISDSKKNLSLLTEIMKPEQDESTLFLLKTPKHLPAVLDNSKNPKIDLSNDEKKTCHKCTIRDLPEGQIGKLQIMKSGGLRLILGECKFWLEQGIKGSFKEELAVVKTDPENRTGEIINLGTIQDRVVVVPENPAANWWLFIFVKYYIPRFWFL